MIVVHDTSVNKRGQTRAESKKRLARHIGLGGEDQIEIISIEVLVKMESIAHNDDLDDAFTVTSGVFRKPFPG
jgi:hypothetical protein